jgi:hypothetical protein
MKNIAHVCVMRKRRSVVATCGDQHSKRMKKKQEHSLSSSSSSHHHHISNIETKLLEILNNLIDKSYVRITLLLQCTIGVGVVVVVVVGCDN